MEVSTKINIGFVEVVLFDGDHQNKIHKNNYSINIVGNHENIPYRRDSSNDQQEDHEDGEYWPVKMLFTLNDDFV